MDARSSAASHGNHIFSVISDSSAPARSAVAASWVRSMQRYGLDPDDMRPPETVTERELREARERIAPLLAIAQPSLDSLYRAVGGAGCCVVFTDRNSLLIDRRGASSDADEHYRWGLWTGAIWSEATEGTNGIGTCIAEQRPLTIHRDQHFHTRNIGLTCSVAPIYDHLGRIAAALDVSSCRADLNEGFAALVAGAVAEAARRIEILNFHQEFRGHRIVVAPDVDRHATALLAVDRDDLVIGATRAARLAYGLTDAKLAKPLSADSLLVNGAERHGDLEQAERGAVQRALANAGGNVSAAAKLLDISRATLHRKMNRLGLHAHPRR